MGGAAASRVFLHPQPALTDKVDREWKQMKLNLGKPILGIHWRGSDAKLDGGYSMNLAPEPLVLSLVEEYTKAHPTSRVFLATEDIENHKAIRKWPKEIQRKVAVRQLPESSFGAVFDQKDWAAKKSNVSKASGRDRAMDVMVDVILLSKCDCLVTGISSIG